MRAGDRAASTGRQCQSDTTCVAYGHNWPRNVGVTCGCRKTQTLHVHAFGGHRPRGTLWAVAHRRTRRSTRVPSHQSMQQLYRCVLAGVSSLCV